MEHLSAALARMVDDAELRLRQVSREESGRPLLHGGWSRKQVLGHLIDSASNNHQRFVRAALADALEFPAYDTPGSVRVQDVEDAAWPMLVDLWASYNRYLAHVIRHLPAAKLDVVCRIGSNAPVSLRYLAEDYVRHLAHHLEQMGIAETTGA
jgi:DinB superfamily